jgi:hypothetical protein
MVQRCVWCTAYQRQGRFLLLSLQLLAGAAPHRWVGVGVPRKEGLRGQPVCSAHRQGCAAYIGLLVITICNIKSCFCSA